MIVAGSEHGMQLLWVLFLSCLFTGVLMYAYGNYALVTNSTALYGFRKHLKYGKALAILVIIGISFGQWNSLMGILGISSNIIFEILSLNFEGLQVYQYEVVLLIAVSIISLFYFTMLLGNYSFFEKLLIVFVSLMGISFVVSIFIVQPMSSDVLWGLIPSIPDVPGGKMLVAAFVGTTMAAATFLSRPLFVQGKKWNISHLKLQKKDYSSGNTYFCY